MAHHTFSCLVLGSLLLITGCATEKQYRVTEGNQTQGVVRVSYDFGALERPVVNDAQSDALARQQCEAWGFREAERASRQERKCLNPTNHGDCLEHRVTNKYQCTGGSAARAKSHQKTLKAAGPKQLSQPVEYLYYAEQAARQAGCSSALNPESVAPGKEVYSTRCGSRIVYVTCNREQCTVE